MTAMPSRGQLADDAEQVGDLVVGEHRARLVHDDQPRVVGQRPRHADHLLAGGGQRADHPGRRDLGVAEAAEDLAGAAGHVAAADEAEDPGLVAEERVLGDAEVVDEVELLVDGGDAGLHGGLRVGEVDHVAEPLDLALVGPVRAGEHLDERGLAGAVLAEEAVHLAGAHFELYAVERPYAREGLDHVGEAQDDVAGAAVRGGLLGRGGGARAAGDRDLLDAPRRRCRPAGAR